MRYVQRDEDGVLVAHFANEQPYAKECVSDDHPDILEWEKKRQSVIEGNLKRKENLMMRLEELEKKWKTT